MTNTAPRDPPPPIPTVSRAEAAGRLGAKLDGLILFLTRLPWQFWTAAAVIVFAGTYPRETRRRTLAGIVLDDRLSIWISRLAVIAVLGAVAAVCFFTVRTLLRYMEQDRWPRAAGGLEMDELTRAQTQLARDADELSSAADAARILSKALDEARDTILLLHGELERVRPSVPHGESSEARRTRSE
jgi:hypothetical protein